MYFGILAGFLAAFFHSVSYLCTRVFVRIHGKEILTLFALSHVIMGGISLVLLIFLIPDEMPALGDYVWKVVGAGGFYLLGQYFLFSALSKSEPSRVSPVLGVKIFMLAMISFLFFDKNLNIWQWSAVILSTFSVLMLYNFGGKKEYLSLFFVFLACFAYCFSDLNIKSLTDEFKYLGVFRGAVISSSFCYVLCGVGGVVFVFINWGKLDRQTWVYSVPFAISWFVAMIFLFSCFAMVGVVFGNILQSTRGIISIVMGYLIAHMGFEVLETKTSKRVFVLRIFAALLMTGAIWLYYSNN